MPLFHVLTKLFPLPFSVDLLGQHTPASPWTGSTPRCGNFLPSSKAFCSKVVYYGTWGRGTAALPVLQPWLEAGPRVMRTPRRRKSQGNCLQLVQEQETGTRCRQGTPHSPQLLPVPLPPSTTSPRRDSATCQAASQLCSASAIISPKSAVSFPPGGQRWRSTCAKAALGSFSQSCSPAERCGAAPKVQTLPFFPGRAGEERRRWRFDAKKRHNLSKSSL